MLEKIICAGFGGQGVLSMGMLLTYSGMLEDKEVSWMPAYGPEMRGGTAHCSVIISDSPVGSPVINDDATLAVVMNLPSLMKFEKEILPGGKIFVNSSLIEKKVERKDIDVYYVDATDLANKLGNPKAANMIMLGALLAADPVVSVESVLQAFTKVFGADKERFIPLNRQALEEGKKAVQNS